jgi:Copper transport outer membrane protein, MctB
VISFRYHLVSLVAVFLALALGIVVGTTALNGPITKDLRHQVNDAKKQRDALALRVKTLEGQVEDAGQFAATYGDQVLTGALKDQNVVTVVLPGATSDMQDGIAREIAAAGGKVSGKVTLTKTYLDPSHGGAIVSLATTSHPIGWTAPETNDSAALGGSLLSYVLLGQGSATDVTQVLAQFSELHMLETDGQSITPSKTVVVIGHGAIDPKEYANQAELALVGALAKGGGHVVVAGDADSATSGGLVASVRASNTDNAAVTTIDNADNPSGQVSTVLALAGAAKGQVGHYGTGKGADALYPAPAK